MDGELRRTKGNDSPGWEEQQGQEGVQLLASELTAGSFNGSHIVGSVFEAAGQGPTEALTWETGSLQGESIEGTCLGGLIAGVSELSVTSNGEAFEAVPPPVDQSSAIHAHDENHGPSDTKDDIAGKEIASLEVAAAVDAEPPTAGTWVESAGTRVESAGTLQATSCQTGSCTTSLPGREESWICAICHNLIPLADTAQVTSCDHHYCANCILQWCSYKSTPWCPQCRMPFESLSLFKMLDGSLSDVMVEESVCLLLRAPWYSPVEIPVFPDPEDEDEDDYDDEEYYRNTLRLGNRRWGGNGYVRNGRMQARVAAAQASDGSSSARRGETSGSASRASHGSTGAAKGLPGNSAGMGRRAKRAQKREEADDSGGGAAPRAGRQSKGRGISL